GFDVLAESEKNLEFATRADPEFVEAWALRAIIQSRQYLQLSSMDNTNPAVSEARDAALAHLDMARSLNPNHVATLRAEGFYSFVVTNDFMQGSRSLDKALVLVPNDTETLTLLAFCYRRLGQIDKAIEILQAVYKQNPDEPIIFYYLTSSLHDTGQYQKLIPIYERALAKYPERKHYLLNKLYYEFLTSGKLEAFQAYEIALRETEITEGCDPAAWRNGRMTMAMLNGEFEAYAQDWHTKWEDHHRGHGDWVCPLQVNEEANHAALLLVNGKDAEAGEIIRESFANIHLPPNPLATCTFDTEMIRPKLLYMSDDPEKAREDLRYAMNKLNNKPDSLLKYIEKSVLLEAADLIAPQLAYSIFKDIQNDPIRMATLETVCATPWTYPQLLANPDFQQDIRADGRFVAFLEHYGFLGSDS
ncbi:MAG TPA: tetratricopeptide repeat protein, partial [Oceanipulchritudo sp.]|nr:tetratricopeptide repeat protein [Oceanipulchritudo sp.]